LVQTQPQQNRKYDLLASGDEVDEDNGEVTGGVVKLNEGDMNAGK